MLYSAGAAHGRRVALMVVTCPPLLAPGTASAQADAGSDQISVVDVGHSSAAANVAGFHVDPTAITLPLSAIGLAAD